MHVLGLSCLFTGFVTDERAFYDNILVLLQNFGMIVKYTMSSIAKITKKGILFNIMNLRSFFAQGADFSPRQLSVFGFETASLSENAKSQTVYPVFTF